MWEIEIEAEKYGIPSKTGVQNRKVLLFYKTRICNRICILKCVDMYILLCETEIYSDYELQWTSRTNAMDYESWK